MHERVWRIIIIIQTKISQNCQVENCLENFSEKKTKFEKLSFHALQVVVHNVPASDGLNQTIRVTSIEDVRFYGKQNNIINVKPV